MVEKSHLQKSKQEGPNIIVEGVDIVIDVATEIVPAAVKVAAPDPGIVEAVVEAAGDVVSNAAEVASDIVGGAVEVAAGVAEVAVEVAVEVISNIDF